MKHKRKESTKPAPKEVKTANMKPRPDKQKENQKKISLILAFLLVFIVFAAIAVPVSYIPFLNNIAQSFGLPTAITRQLTLIDLALNSLGVETDSMKVAFKQNDITAGPMNPVLYSRFEPEISHLIDARETYFYEYERTHRRPEEIAGIYKDGKEVNTPNLKQGQVGGVRSLPKEAEIKDDTFPGSSYQDGSYGGAYPNGAAYNVASAGRGSVGGKSSVGASYGKNSSAGGTANGGVNNTAGNGTNNNGATNNGVAYNSNTRNGTSYNGSAEYDVNGDLDEGAVDADGKPLSGSAARGASSRYARNAAGDNDFEDAVFEEGESSSKRNSLDNRGRSGSAFGSRSFRGASYSAGSGDSFSANAGSSVGSRGSRKSFDKTKDADGNPAAMPGFVSSVYANSAPQQGKGTNNSVGQPIDLNNSGMVKPVVKGTSFSVRKGETPLEHFIGNSEFANNLTGLHPFGGHSTLGFYVADDLPRNTGRGTFQKFGVSGEDAISSYFYSYIASGRKYAESAKYLSEVAFNGENVDIEEVLVAHGQKNRKPITLSEDASPFTIMTKVQENIRTCNQAEKHYWAVTQPLRQEYIEKQNHLKSISNNDEDPYKNDIPKGAPGSCASTVSLRIEIWNPFGSNWEISALSVDTPLNDIRSDWNSTVDRLKELCNLLQAEEETYVHACNMRYEINDTLDICNSIAALHIRTDGVSTSYDFGQQAIAWWDQVVNGNDDAWRNLDCAEEVRWRHLSLSPTLNASNGCNTPQSCQDSIDTLLDNIDKNVKITPSGNFLGN